MAVITDEAASALLDQASGQITGEDGAGGVNATAGIATGTGTAQPATVTTSSSASAPAGLATGTGTAKTTAFRYAPAETALAAGTAKQAFVPGTVVTLTALAISPTRLTMAAAGNSRTLGVPGSTGPANATVIAAGATQRTLNVSPTTGEGGP